MKGRKPLLLFFIFFSLFLFLSDMRGDETAAVSQAGVQQDQNISSKIIPVPANPRQKTGIYVFLFWIWIVIFILIYFIRQKIRELDRLNDLEFFSDSG